MVALLVALVSMMVAPWREALPILVIRWGGTLGMKPMLMACWMLYMGLSGVGVELVRGPLCPSDISPAERGQPCRLSTPPFHPVTLTPGSSPGQALALFHEEEGVLRNATSRPPPGIPCEHRFAGSRPLTLREGDGFGGIYRRACTDLQSVEALAMRRDNRLRLRILSGRSDGNIRFEELRRFLLRLGFDERIRGSDRIFRKHGVPELVNLQRDGSQAKPYQVR